MIIPGVQKPHWRPCWSQNACWSGWRVAPSAIPSIVLISRPSALTASIVHDLALSPSTRTVHAPQLLVSQPMCVPVSPKTSRRRWTSRRRGSTSASLRLAVDGEVDLVGGHRTLLSLRQRALDGAAQGPDGHLLDHRPLVVDRAVGVGDRSGLGRRGRAGRPEGRLVRLGADQRRLRRPSTRTASRRRRSGRSRRRRSGHRRRSRPSPRQPTVEKSPARRSSFA